jgi:hypothetical protein
MTLRQKVVIACAALAGIGVLLALVQRGEPEAAAPQKPAAEPRRSAVVQAPEWPASIRTLIIGGGPLPDASEVSLEQNVRLAQSVLPGPSVALFAGGPGTQSVRTDDIPAASTLLVRLGDLFAPRPSRSSRFRASELSARRADLATIEAALERALGERNDAPLTLYIAAHGEQAELAADNAALVWGNDAITPRRLAELHDASKRPLQLVVTSCFSGGFAELAFRATDPAQGAPRALRCGLFAGPWDRETSGCDPDPNRAAQESYSLHMLNALAQRDRYGQPLPAQRVDFDGDGEVSPLEAHAYARIMADSIDMPTTTSERYLRSVQATGAPDERAIKLLPEDAAVARELSRALELKGEQAARAAVRELEAARAEHAERVRDAEDALDRAYWPLVTRLLERFPVLDDPYHPDFAATLRDHEAEIDALLTRSPEAAAHRQANNALAGADAAAVTVELRETRAQRLVRAYDTLALAAALERRGGPELARFRALLACERATTRTNRDGAPGVR